MRKGTDLAFPEDFVDLSGREIADPDVAREVVAHEVFHGVPGVEDGGVLVDDRAAAGRVGKEGHGPVH